MKFSKGAQLEREVLAINLNMRCIEMRKLGSAAVEKIAINLNMRCIEILRGSHASGTYVPINLNMRCIEMEVLLYDF